MDKDIIEWNEYQPKNGKTCFFTEENFNQYSKFPPLEERIIQTLQDFQRNINRGSSKDKKMNKDEIKKEESVADDESWGNIQTCVKEEEINTALKKVVDGSDKKTNIKSGLQYKDEGYWKKNIDYNSRFNDVRLCRAIIPPPRKSLLTQQEHHQYLLLYPKYANMRRAPKETEIAEYDSFQKFKEIITAEQKEFMHYLEKLAKANMSDYTYMTPGGSKYVEEWLNSRRKEVEYYNKYYNKMDNFPLHVQPTQMSPQLIYNQTLLQLGSVPKMIVPDLSTGNRPIVPTDYQAVVKNYPVTRPKTISGWNHQPCSLDTNAETLANGYKANVVLSSGSLQCLVDNHAPSYNREWELPVLVKEQEYIDGDRKVIHKTVYIDRPFISNKIDMREKHSKFLKNAFKTYALRSGQVGHIFTIPKKTSENISTSNLLHSKNQSSKRQSENITEINVQTDLLSPQLPVATETSDDNLFDVSLTEDIDNLETFGTLSKKSKHTVSENKASETINYDIFGTDIDIESPDNSCSKSNSKVKSKAVETLCKADDNNDSGVHSILKSFDISDRDEGNDNDEAILLMEENVKRSRKVNNEKNVENLNMKFKRGSSIQDIEACSPEKIRRTSSSEIPPRSRLDSSSSCDSESERLLIEYDSQEDKTKLTKHDKERMIKSLNMETEEYIDEPPASPDMENPTDESFLGGPASPDAPASQDRCMSLDKKMEVCYNSSLSKGNFFSPGGRKCVLIPLQRDNAGEENVMDHSESLLQDSDREEIVMDHLHSDSLFPTPPLIPKTKKHTQRIRSSLKSESSTEKEGDDYFLKPNTDSHDLSKSSRVRPDKIDDIDTDRDENLVMNVPDLKPDVTVLPSRSTRYNIRTRNQSKNEKLTRNESDSLKMKEKRGFKETLDMLEKITDKRRSRFSDSDVDIRRDVKMEASESNTGNDNTRSKGRYRTRSAGSVDKLGQCETEIKKEKVKESVSELKENDTLFEGSSLPVDKHEELSENMKNSTRATRRSKRNMFTTIDKCKNTSLETVTNTLESIPQDQPKEKRGRGRPRKSHNPMEKSKTSVQTESLSIMRQSSTSSVTDEATKNDNSSKVQSTSPILVKSHGDRHIKVSPEKADNLSENETETTKTQLNSCVETLDSNITAKQNSHLSTINISSAKNTECNSTDKNSQTSENSNIDNQKTHIRNTAIEGSKCRKQNLKRKTSLDDEKQNSSTLDTILQLQEKMLHTEGHNVPSKGSRLGGTEVSSVISDDHAYKCPEKNNITYHLWTLGGFRVIIRCGYHGIYKNRRQQMSYAHIVPKLEYQTSYGREVLTTSEISRSYFSTYIRPNTRLVRARINPLKSELVVVEELGLDQIILKNTEPVYNPMVGFEMIHNIFQRLYQLPAGQYLLQHLNGSPDCQIKKATENNKRGAYDLHFQYLGFMSSTSTTSQSLPWLPIDTNIILSLHKKQNRVPATFEPKDFRGKKRKKKKKKNQKQN